MGKSRGTEKSVVRGELVVVKPSVSVCVRERVCVCVCVREIERVCVCGRACVCDRESEGVSVCE